VVAEAYEFLVDRWQPGDRVYIFGVGRGGYCAQALARLVGAVGVLPDLMDYVLATYAVPRTPRTPQDWQRVADVAARLSGGRENGIPVAFLGLWDAMRLTRFTWRSTPVSMPNVVSGRHAVAIDGPIGAQLVGAEHVDEVWFRGAHCDVAGGAKACVPLADIALDWVLDGAIAAGIAVRSPVPPTGIDALAGSAHTISMRKLPADASLHASVGIYLREHPEYWRRLPARVMWADPDWAARGERLVPQQRVAVGPRQVVAAAS
jgi:hypothetical protein